MDVDDGVTGQVEHGAGEDASVGRDHDEVRLDGGELGDDILVAKCFRLEDGNVEAFGLDLAAGARMRPPRPAGRLGCVTARRRS